MNKANLNKNISPAWDLAYDFKSEYNLNDLSNQSIYNLAFNALVNDKEILTKYVSNYWTGSSKLIPANINVIVKSYFTCMAQNVIFDNRFKCLGIYTLTNYPYELLFKFLQTV